IVSASVNTAVTIENHDSVEDTVTLFGAPAGSSDSMIVWVNGSYSSDDTLEIISYRSDEQVNIDFTSVLGVGGVQLTSYSGLEHLSIIRRNAGQMSVTTKADADFNDLVINETSDNDSLDLDARDPHMPVTVLSNGGTDSFHIDGSPYAS